AVSNSARPPAPPAAAPGTVPKAEIAEERGDNGKQETPEIAVERKHAKPAPPEPPAEGPQLVPAPAALQAPSSSSGERAPTSDTQRFAEDEDRPPAGSPLPSDDQVLPNVSATSGKKSDVDVSVPTVVQPPPASRHVI